MLRLVLATLWRVLARRRGQAPTLVPEDPADYMFGDVAAPAQGLAADAIPVAKTPPGGYRTFPPRVLDGCSEPLPPSAPDLRGVWRVYKGLLRGHLERIEQCGDRVVITAAGVIHDMRADGSLQHGVHDVSEPTGRPIAVVAEFKGGRMNLRPNGGPVVVVSRWRDGSEMVWRYGIFVNRLRRVSDPGDARTM